MTATVKQALLEAFELLGGVPALVEWGEKHPTQFYALWGKLLPRETKTSEAEPFNIRIVEQVVTAEDVHNDRYSDPALSGASEVPA